MSDKCALLCGRVSRSTPRMMVSRAPIPLLEGWVDEKAFVR